MSARLKILVTPRSSKNEIVGWRDAHSPSQGRPDGKRSWLEDHQLAIKLTAPPVEGAANKACIGFIADLLTVKKSQVRIVSGGKSREKIVEIEGLTDDEVRVRIDSSSRV